MQATCRNLVMVQTHSSASDGVFLQKRVLSSALALTLLLLPVAWSVPASSVQAIESTPTTSSESQAPSGPESTATSSAGSTSSGSVELHPAALIGKSLGAYGGEDVVQKLLRGMAIVGKQFDQVSLDSDEKPREGLEADSTVRIVRKGARWRVDHERLNSSPEGAETRPVAYTEGFDGNTAWIRNGATTEDLPVDSANLLNWQTMPPALFLLETKRAMEESADAVAVSYAGKDKSGAHKIEVKNLKDATQSFVLLIEPNSFLLTAVEFGLGAGGSRRVAIEYGEYRPALSTVYPFRQLRRVNGKASELWIVTDANALDSRVSNNDFERPGGTTHLSRSVVLPFDYSQKEILVKGRLNNGEEVDFIFDTGASETIIDRRIAAENFLLKEGQAALAALSGSIATNTTTISRLELGGLIVNDMDARILDLSGQSRQLGRRLAGIIGTNIISKYVVAIDYGKAQITFHDADTFVRPQDVVSVPFSRRSAPVIKVRLGAKEDVQMLVDTGAAFNNLPASIATRYSGVDAVKRLTEGTGLDGRPVKLGRVTIDNVSIGGRNVHKVDFTYTVPNPALTSNGKPAASGGESKSQGFFQTTNLGIVGNPLLENFIVFIDYKFQRMLLKSSSTVKLRSEIEQAVSTGDDQLIQKRDFRLAEQAYQRALLSATSAGDKKNEARVLGRLGNLKRMMSKDLNRPEHSKSAYEYFVRAQELAKRIGATEVEGRILADWSLLYLDKGQPTSAQQTMDRALFLAPQDAGVNVDCSVHLYKANRFPEMQRYIEKALFLEPNNWQALWYQVKLSETFNDQAKAISTLKEILHYYPWSKPAQAKLEELKKSAAEMAAATAQAAGQAEQARKQNSSSNQQPLKNYVPAGNSTSTPQNNYTFKKPNFTQGRNFIYGPNTTPNMVPFRR